MYVPLLSGFFKLVIHTDGTGLRGPAHGEFHDHSGKTKEDKAGGIDEHKTASAVLSGHPREFPYVAAAYGAAGTKHDEAEPASKSFSFLTHSLSLPLYCIRKLIDKTLSF